MLEFMATQFTRCAFTISCNTTAFVIYRSAHARTSQSLKFIYIPFKNFVPTSKKTHCVYLAKTEWLWCLGK
jgi:hypothetical protein